MSVLHEICDKKREHVLAQKARTPIAQIKDKIDEQSAPRGFINRIQDVSQNGPAIITEVKKASPSKGVIREDFNPADIANIYTQNGAACISVLTDTPYFQGKDEHFMAVREITALPLIRKDFMVDEYQIYESRALGADCILIIMAALNDSEAENLYNLSTELGMDVLVEVHDEEELERALTLNPKMVGVNNRNLKTLNVDVQTSFDLIEKMPANITKIAESGLTDYETLAKLQNAGYQGFLIGESLMRQNDIASALKNMIGKN